MPRQYIKTRIPLTCIQCLCPFEAKPSEVRRRQVRFCSRQCYDQYRHENGSDQVTIGTWILRRCLHCHQEFAARPSEVYRRQGGVQFCSRDCWQRFTLATFEDRFFAKVIKDTPSGCWLWTGKATASPKKCKYGRTINRNGTEDQAHRVSWQIHYGPIPGGLSVLHHCDTPLCVRPDHLFLGTNLDNIRDMISKGRSKSIGLTGEDNPHAKLSWTEVRSIREEFKKGVATYIALAHQYGVSKKTIAKIIRGESWQQVA